MQPIVKFIDKICSNCQNLEFLKYVVNLDAIGIIGITDKFPKVPSKDEDIFPKLTYIQLKFYYDDLISDPVLTDAAVDNFTKYLTTKCPNLEKPIQFGETDDGFANVIFGSCITSESEFESSISSMENEQD